MSNSLHVREVKTADDLTMAMMVRAIVWCGERGFPMMEELDGNDVIAAHGLLFDGDEPIGTGRMRFFADFAKLDRTCIRAEYRNLKAVRALTKGAVEFCRAKGYTKMVTHAERHLVPLWTRLGFKLREEVPAFSYSGIEFVEMVYECEQSEEAVTIDTDPIIKDRAEGQWDTPLPHEARIVRSPLVTAA